MIPLFKAYMNDSVIGGIGSVLNSGRLSGGEFTEKFEKGISTIISNPFFLSLSVNSLEFALKLLDLKEGDEVISSPMSCLATNQPILNVGAKVVWADIDPFTGSLDPESVREKITKNTKAIIHFHWGGYPGYIDEINAIGREFGIKIIEDATESFGSKYKDAYLGSSPADLCCFSFTGVRLPNTIDGYGIAFSSEEIYEKAKKISDYGIDRKSFRDDLGEISTNCDIDVVGQGAKLNNIASYVGYSQLNNLDALFEKQQKNAEYWDRIYDENSRVINRLNSRTDISPNYWVYTINVEKRDDFLLKMRKEGFYSSKMHLRNDFYSVFGKKQPDLIGVKKFSETQLNIPCGWWIDVE
ncbi:aminotransferase class V-fold PLP-dependent enzyme [Marivirga harenae]|uniref:DegT/DnrJ/EryC1/StrS family aminotransferase n=1 Tax=Marivirga harenae TaxID=2010992 RepID=UPI0026E02A69|nr:aminotransferase class V-fold PLP-dependent enzyme [Marivirga harenae]WKV13136.1 aminotransferase class V-fold PLP-dependent enzyme [Marivirga harenae]|tara:strand:- start:281752 stop:282816 length:1065 start_codon:yes stop_codon:yes gene_type:complete